VALEELVGQPVRVVWADWRRGHRLGGNLVLTAVSKDNSTLYFKGREMCFHLEAQWVVAVQPAVDQ